MPKETRGTGNIERKRIDNLLKHIYREYPELSKEEKLDFKKLLLKKELREMRSTGG